jgi:signal transduction histidine kinase
MTDLAEDTYSRLGILVVDDEPEIVTLLARFLARRGHRVMTAHDADAASRAVAQDLGLGVVLSDVRMPGRDGLQLAEEMLRQRGDADALEVVLLTGGATTDVAVGALRVGTFDLLRKPPRLTEVADVVDRAMQRCQARRAKGAALARIAAEMQAVAAERERLALQLAQSSARLSDVESALGASRKLRRDLLAVLSHEMRSPLIPILGFSEVFASGAVPDMASQREYGQLIHDSATRLLRIIDAALDIVALGDGRSVAAAVPDMVPRLAGSVAEAARAGAQAHGVSLILEGPPDLRLVGDHRLLESALGQLVDNAIRASPRGGLVRIGWQAEGAMLAIWVRDAGDGVPDAILAQLGTPFLQADMSFTRVWPGAGLGLALAQRVARAHGGTLSLRALPGGGTEARLTLPASGQAAAGGATGSDPGR